MLRQFDQAESGRGCFAGNRRGLFCPRHVDEKLHRLWACLSQEIDSNQITAGARKGEEDLGFAVLDRLPEIVRMDMAEHLHVVAHDEHVQLAGRDASLASGWAAPNRRRA
jgi:hypothetical protein